jgi:Ca2+-binding RTX toxin-like protein
VADADRPFLSGAQSFSAERSISGRARRHHPAFAIRLFICEAGIMATFTGTAGSDNLKGTTDADTLQGLAGNDAYTVDHTDDVVVEVPGEGVDTITTSVTYDLSDEVENLILTGIGSLDAKANDLSNSITGNKGGNHLYTLDGVDTVSAGLGDDTVDAGAFLAADDRLDGGVGTDRLQLEGDYSAGVTLGAATLVNFEKITLVDGNSYALTLNDATNSSSLLVKGNRLTTGTLNLDGSAETKSSLTAFGGSGDDTLIGGGGSDVLRGGGGADIVTGGAGSDTASYASSKDGVTVDLTDNGNNAGGDAAGDTLTGIENLTGSDVNDSLTGDDNSNVLDGGNGDDTLAAGAGNDKILGGGGFDVLSLGNNLTAADTIDGGDDYDVLSFGGNFSAGLTLGKSITNIEELALEDGNSYKFTLTAAANSSTLLIDGSALTGANRIIVNGAAENLNSLTAIGGEGNDSLVGGLVADTLSGGSAGNDTIQAGGGDDLIDQGSGLNGLDKIDGGAGKDTLLLSGDYSGGVTFSATTVTGVETILLDSAFSYNLTLNNGTNKASLTVDGQTRNAGAMIIDGSAETSNALTLLGGDGDDKLIGGGGADSLIGGAGADSLTGGGGIDTVDYALSVDGVNVNLTSGLGANGDADGDVLSGIEHVIGTGLDDSITGSAAANKLLGGFGNDALAGGAGGNDLLDGAENDDTFLMGAGMTAADTLVGGSGFDTLQLSGNYAGGLTFGASTVSKIEEILLIAGNSYKLTVHDETAGLTLFVNGSALGAGNFLQLNAAAEKTSDVTIWGGAGNDTLIGGGGNDDISGNDGNDILTGGEGDNGLDGGKGNDKLTVGNGHNLLTGGDGTDILTAGNGDDTLDGGIGDDKLTAGNGANLLFGGDGADILTAGTGKDQLDGGAGNDKLNGGNGANTLTGGAGFDTLVGGADTDIITGGGDNDNISGGAGTNQMLGDAGADTIVGGAGSDTLDGGADNDSLSGGGGTNMFAGGTGADTIVGGAGIDTATYAASAAGVIIDLTSAAAQVGGDAAGDRLSGIEHVIGSAKDDSLTGSAANNQLEGAAGVDTLRGGLGNDTLDGGAETDIIDGGAGVDLVSYASSSSGVSIDLSLATQSGGDAEGESYVGIEGVLGSNLNDTLSGNAGVNSLAGGGGGDKFVMGANLTAADSIDGGSGIDTVVLDGNYAAGLTFAATTLKDVEIVSLTAGNSYKLTLTDANNSGTLTVDGSALGANTLFLAASAEKNNALTAIGASGNDTLTGGGGNDSFTGGAGADRLTGGGGSDTANYGASAAAITVNLNLVSAQVSAGDANGDILSGIENVIGTAQADALTGNAGANALTGGGGNDTLTGGAGGDKLDGGGGADTADYSGSKAGITVRFGGAVSSGGDAAGDTLTGIETVIGTKFNDTFVENVEAHTLQGGAGTDTVDYSGSPAITADLDAGTADGDKLVDIESIIGSSGNDKITGSAASNSLSGGKGADTLNAGSGGDDTLLGGDGNDEITVTVLTAKDQIDGGAHEDNSVTKKTIEGDTLFVSGDHSAGVTFAAATVQNVEEIELVDGFDYVFKAHNATNSEKLVVDASALGVGSSFSFDASAETANSYVFFTGAGADTVTGGKGIDLLTFSKASSGATANLEDASLNDGFSLGDVYARIENILGSEFDDVLTGDKGNNILEGGKGGDALFGGAGNDTLSGGINLLGEKADLLVGDDGFDAFDGGDGIDLIDFTEATGPVFVDLLNGFGMQAANGDTFVNIENLIGTKSEDELYGDASNNRIEGSKGNDTLGGDLGTDTLLGGEGADVFAETVLTAKDRIIGGDEVDDLNTEFIFEGDTLQLNGDFSLGLTLAAATAQGIEKIEAIGGWSYVLRLDNATNSSSMIVDASTLNLNDTFKLDASKETFHSFTLLGGLGNDTMVAGAGSDILVGNFGADSLVGGKGSDTAGYQNSFEAVNIDLNLKTAQLGTGTDDASGDILVLIENLRGSDFNDVLVGDKNGNILEGGKGFDTLNGGLGTDVASYEHLDEAVEINLLDPTKNTGAAAEDVYMSIEGAIGGSKEDKITGNGSANYIDGGAGADTLIAGHGNDTVLGGEGNDRIELGFSLNALDRIDGGKGDDTVILDGNYSTNVTLGATTLTNVETLQLTAGNNYRFTLVDGNNTNGLTIDGKALEEDEVLVINGAAEKSARLTVFAGADNDSIAGGGGGDTLQGAAGADLLIGNGGNDNLAGDDGNDSMVGGDGDDTIAGGTGVDTMLGGAGSDTFEMLENLTASDRIDGGTGTDTLSLDGDYSKGVVFGAATMRNVEIIELAAGNDYMLVMDQGTNNGTLTVDGKPLEFGDSLDFNGTLENKDSFNVISGKGNDLVLVGAGADSIDGGFGADTLDGGAGIDTVIYERSAAGVTVDLTNNANNAGGDAAGDMLANFENMVGSKLDDKLTGNNLANLIVGGAGGDTMDGGLGIDTASYVTSGDAVTVDLAAGLGFAGDADGDELISIENLIGSEAVPLDPRFLLGDDLFGNDIANLIDGRQGDDVLFGRGGNDTLLGGAGRDVLEGGIGADIIDGGFGEDQVRYANSAAAVVVDLTLTKGQISSGDANGDIISGIENIFGSAFNDKLKGNALSNDFEGAAGADTIIGGGGADAANYFSSNAAVQVSLAIAGPQVSTGHASGDVLIGINTIRGSGFADKLTGDNLGNGFFGADGNDTITGGGGSDMFEFNNTFEGIDLITDFQLGVGGDFLQIVDVLEPPDGVSVLEDVDKFARIQQIGGDSHFQVNVDGEGNDWETIAILQGVSSFGLTADKMLENGNLQVTGEF